MQLVGLTTEKLLPTALVQEWSNNLIIPFKEPLALPTSLKSNNLTFLSLRYWLPSVTKANNLTNFLSGVEPLALSLYLRVNQFDFVL